MIAEEKAKHIAEAKAIAVLGFEQGFRAAVECVEGLTAGANDPRARQFAEIAAAAMRQIMPQAVQDAKEGFTFDYIDVEGQERKIRFQ